MLLDLDGFKEINDTLGHAAGDGVLRPSPPAGEPLGDRTSSVGRLGGDEFALVVAEDDPRRARWRSPGRCARCCSGRSRWTSLELAIDASIGITVRQPATDTATDLLRRADVAMYEAKNTRAGALLYDVTRDDFSPPAAAAGRGAAPRASPTGSWSSGTSRRSTPHPAGRRGVEALVRW